MDPRARPGEVIAVSAIGRDRRGLIAALSGTVTDLGGNIVHVEQSSIAGLFSMFMLVEPENLPPGLDAYRFAYELSMRGRDLGLDVRAEVERPESAASRVDKDLRVITIVGSDKPGVMHAIASTLAQAGANIERLHHVARGDFMAFDILADVRGVDFERLRHDLRATCERVGVDAVVQPDSMFRTRKRLVVFDMDSTIVDGEVIDELAHAAGVGSVVSEITAKAMRGEIDFQEALKARVRLLKGLRVEDLERIADSLKLTPGTFDLVTTLKAMGFRLALISGGFTFFTDRLKRDLGFDHAFANELEIKDGVVTGEVVGGIIDMARKGEILRELAALEGLTRDEVVAIGDGANDQVMIRNAGLGIAFNAKDILKRAADGSISKSNIRGLLYALGATTADVKRFTGDA
ncbi:MAG TPA: phosphoserine phosphatase SerB [Candidatus Thermoplasmatota archaeon]|nr:phosphoserine phosphatase SerB [Candidatus Thermoplasmatota archaeon]